MVEKLQIRFFPAGPEENNPRQFRNTIDHHFLILLLSLAFTASHKLCAEVFAGIQTMGLEESRVAALASLEPPDYVPLDELQAAFDLKATVDALSRVHQIHGPNIDAVLCPGMSHILIDNTLHHLPLPVLSVGGRTLVPFDVARLMRQRGSPPKVSVSAPKVSKSPPPDIKVIRTLVIDAGHGGKDPGAIGSKGLQEKEITLDVVERLKRLLEQRDYHVVLTRSTDSYLTLKERVEICQREQPDLFVSIHINASPNHSATGFETYFSATRLTLSSDEGAAPRMGDLDKRLGPAGAHLSREDREFLYALYFGEFQAEGHRLANSIQTALVSSFSNRLDRGVKPGRWFVVRWSQSPAVLVELGFISNPGTESLMKAAAHRDQLARALLQGIEKYLY